MFKRSQAIAEKTLGSSNPKFATSLSNVASLYNAQGRYADAEPLLKRSLAISEKALGRDHPQGAYPMNSLAELYHEPDQEQRKRAWASCAFVNYVQDMVGKGAAARPTAKMCRAAQQPFLDMLEELRPRRIIVLGKTMWREMPDCKKFQKWAPIAFLNVVVRDGVVELWGTITDERGRQAIIVAAQNIPGVKDVQDHMVWVDPMSGVVIDAKGEVLAS